MSNYPPLNLQEMKKALLITVTAMMCFVHRDYAQCPSVLTATVNVLPANCPSSGAATVSTNAPAGTPLIFTLLSGPQGTPVNAPQSNNVFNGLLAGSYTVKAECTN